MDTLVRRKTLTNSAAEYVEKRVDIKALYPPDRPTKEFNDLHDVSEFVPAIDLFALKGDNLSVESCYEQSKTSMETFSGTLKKFAAILRERKVDSNLKIVIRDPSEFDLQYVLGIVNNLSEGGDSSSKTGLFKKFIHSCYQKVENNKAVIEGILSLIPSDIYGSVISGGFTLILAAVEKKVKERKRIQDWLAEIPKKLETIQRLSGIHRKSLRLHTCADTIIVAIFTVLERILDKVTKPLLGNLTEAGSKMTQRLKSGIFLRNSSHRKSNENSSVGELCVYGVVDEEDEERKLSVAEALDRLDKKIEDFKEQANICGVEMLDRVERGVGDGRNDMVILMAKQENRALYRDAMLRTYIEEEIALNGKKNCEILFTYFQNTLYNFCASNPNFNTKTGEIDHETVERRKREEAARSIRLRQRDIWPLAEWLKNFKGSIYNPMVDMKDCLEHQELLEYDEKNISQWILKSDQHTQWLKEERSSVLEIEPNTPPGSLNNPMSFNSALVATTIQSTNRFPVLAFFCRHRNVESSWQDTSGPTVLIKSLNVQLLRFIIDRSSVDLSGLRDQELLSKAKKSFKHGLLLFEKLLWSLPSDEMVFIIIDSLSLLWGSEQDKKIRMLIQIIRKIDNIVIKVMVTDVYTASCFKGVADYLLHVPDVVGGHGVIDTAENKHEIVEKIKFKHNVKGGYGEDDEEEGEEEDEGEEEEDEEGDGDDSDGDEED
ncbi:hypothetical protein EAE96_004051 [Botrytis aclada]|nr:hypothetical protein EAE96_004051 [Botrytis aclada]